MFCGHYIFQFDFELSCNALHLLIVDFTLFRQWVRLAEGIWRLRGRYCPERPRVILQTAFSEVVPS